MNIDKELITYLESLSKLSLGPDEAASLAKDLQSILGKMEKLGELDTTPFVASQRRKADCKQALAEDASVTGQDRLNSRTASGLYNVLRADEVRPSYPRTEVLSGGIDPLADAFIAPKTVE